jgi:Arc/MetJ-type ribon-helix-helix transcriptional regulator
MFYIYYIEFDLYDKVPSLERKLYLLWSNWGYLSGIMIMAVRDVKTRLKNRPPAIEAPINRLYSMLPSDLELIEALADKFNQKGARINNSEVVRAGLIALQEMKEEQWVNVISRLPKCRQNKQTEHTASTESHKRSDTR